MMYPRLKQLPKLHWLERRLLLTLREGDLYVEDAAEKARLSRDSVLRATELLSSKKLLGVEMERETFLSLGSEGRLFLMEKLPERRLVKAILRLKGKALLDEAIAEAGLSREEGIIATGWAKRKRWIRLQREKEGIVVYVEKEPPLGSDEKLIAKLGKKRVPRSKLSRGLLKGLDMLRGRPDAIRIEEEVRKLLSLTKAGAEVARKIKEVEEVSLLTPELIRTGRWRRIKLRRYDVEAPAPVVYPGKIHPIKQIIRQIKEIFLQLGFVEIQGPLVETAFWNFDALFQPQDHPAREMMDTFYLLEPELGKLPANEIVEKVKKTHENGWITGSTGWGYKWDPNEARKLVMRTHTTSVTIRFLAKHKEPPIKVFSVDRVYRNERVDRKHLAEFHQIEGIIMDKHVTLRDLMGILKEFYLRLGLKAVRFWPSYFPYTEPSVQSTVYVPEIKSWVELCGMGMFRPEVLKPLGIDYPVLAWGGGLERLIAVKLGIDDLRYLYRNDLSWIRGFSLCQL